MSMSKKALEELFCWSPEMFPHLWGLLTFCLGCIFTSEKCVS